MHNFLASQPDLNFHNPDVQDALLETNGRWPLCRACDHLEPHALYVHPDLGGPEPTWCCEHAGIEVAPVGGLY